MPASIPRNGGRNYGSTVSEKRMSKKVTGRFPRAPFEPSVAVELDPRYSAVAQQLEPKWLRTSTNVWISNSRQDTQ